MPYCGVMLRGSQGLTMDLDWAKLSRQPQTYLLLVAAGLGYALLLAAVGTTPLALLVGGLIGAVMVGHWGWGFRHQPPSAGEASNLLLAPAFEHRLVSLGDRVPASGQSTWQQARTWATESQQLAAQIGQRDPLLQVELLETLHTVLHLSGQVADALAVQPQVQTPTYQALAAERLDTSCDRLQATRDQLQQLQDQLAISALDSSATAALPQGLQTLIQANRQILADPPPPP